jgi:spore germination protein YaaH
MKERAIRLSSLAWLVVAAAGCGWSSGHETEQVGLGSGTPLTPRAGTVVADGCVLDTWQRATLASPAAKKVLREVVLLCLVPRLDGTVGPRDPSATGALADLVTSLHGDSYRVLFGISFTDETGQRYDGGQTRAFLANPAWREQLATSLVPLAALADGVAVDIQKVPSDATADVTALFARLAPVLHPARRLDAFVPPSVATPSDLPGGDPFSRKALAPYVDRMRVMTLDYSDSAPGPTIDPGWAVDAVRHTKASSPNVDIAYPLYGTDFGPHGTRSVTYQEARAVADENGLVFQRGPTGAPWFDYGGVDGAPHALWFDDAESTGRALGAWTPDVLPLDVGVLFYGLGAEDPTLFPRLAERLP